jgi:hypothetical protein
MHIHDGRSADAGSVAIDSANQPVNVIPKLPVLLDSLA